MLKHLFSRRNATPPTTTLAAGQRVYAVGDVHGRLDLLDDLLTKIDADDATRDDAETTLIFLGDLVDRGPDSAGVVERLRLLARARQNARFLLGNHEEVFLLTIAGDDRAARLFCRIGGRETAISYGIPPDEYEQLAYPEVIDRLQALVPTSHRDFLGAFEDLIVLGDYAFAHAGVRPGVAIDAQNAEDLRWIREPFLDHRGLLEKIVVHGHSIRPEVEMLPHRIGIDTGGYANGTLTALGLEGEERWTLQT